MRSVVASTVGILCVALSVSVHPAAAASPDEVVGLDVSPATEEVLDEGELSLVAVTPVTTAASEDFLFPVGNVVYRPSGTPRRVRLLGGLEIAGLEGSLRMTDMKVDLSKGSASVRLSSPDTRVAALDVSRVKVGKRYVRGDLVIAPGTSALLNEHFSTYVFIDGLRLGRIRIPL